MFVTCNFTLIERILSDGLPNRVLALAKIEAPDHEGLPLEAEAIALNRSEDKLLREAAGLTAAMIYGGRITYNGQRLLCFYSKVADPFGPGPSFSVKMGEYRWDIYYDTDSDQRFLRGAMHPTPEELRTARDQAVLRRLSEEGDNSSAMRPITCTARFADAVSASTAALMFKENNFKITDPARSPEGWWMLTFTYDCTTEPKAIDELSTYIVSVTEQTNGRFEGWTCKSTK